MRKLFPTVLAFGVILGSFGIWSCNSSSTSVIEQDTAAVVIAYKQSSINVIKGVAIVPDTVVSSGGAVKRFSIRPSLPTGLNLDTNTGLISGTPSAPTAFTNDTVIATGPTGIDTAIIVLSTPALESVIWTGNQLVAVGNNGVVLTSLNGVSWTSRYSGTTKNLNDVTWAGSLLVAVGDSGTILVSSDGSAWTNRTSGVTNPSGTRTIISSITWTGHQLVAVGYSDAFGGAILTSPDAIAWVHQSIASPLSSVAWTGSQLVAVGETPFVSTGYPRAQSPILTSTDGLNWASQSSNTQSALSSVTSTNSQLVAVGISGTILTSPDGIAWTSRHSGITSGLNSVNGSGTKLVVVGYGGAILTSVDGLTWLNQASGTTNILLSVAWTGDQYATVGDVGTILTSVDGITWKNSNP